MSEAAKAWTDMDFAEASELYKAAWLLDSSDLFCAFRLAESYRMDNRYSDAASVYEFLTAKPQAKESYPETWFYLAIMTKQKGEYNDFCDLLAKYLLIAKDNELIAKARNELRVCEDPGLLPKDSIPMQIMHLGKSINTPYSEFGAFQLSDTNLIFSALRPTSGSEFQSFARYDYRTAIYSSEIRVSGYQRGEEISTRINRRNTHNANLTYDPENSRVFFSRCMEAGKGDMKCHIMVTSYNDKGRWRRPERVAGNINLDGYTNTQPYFSRIGETGVLYFVSDRPGGFGGLDIWYAIEQKNGFSEPVNCGSIINTLGNEVTPFFDTMRSALFFSSDWHPGYGGYDVFMSKGGLAAWEKVKNVGLPVNSPANDYYFSVNPTDSNGYFTSNRPGSFHLRGETCCNDIYFYEWIPEPSLTDIPDMPVAENPDTIQELARRLLPLMLFFHNDEPDAATMSTTSTKDFKQSLDEYVAMKHLYKREYARGLSGNEARQAEQDIEDFFSNYALKGYDRLEMLTEFLIQDLNAGNSVQVLVSGYCSPLSTNEYNINLARRRINSLVKYLETTRDGILTPYLNGTADGDVKLVIFEDPIGKEKASPFVSDNPHDLRNSVYSRAAAFERRIEIALYVSHKPGEMQLLSEMPSFSTPDDTIRLEPLKSGESRVVSIPYFNEGKSELLIREIVFNGDRLWVEWSNEPLLPGNGNRLLVLITAGNEHEKFIEDIIITTNLPNKSIITLLGDVKD